MVYAPDGRSHPPTPPAMSANDNHSHLGAMPPAPLHQLRNDDYMANLLMGRGEIGGQTTPMESPVEGPTVGGRGRYGPRAMDRGRGRYGPWRAVGARLGEYVYVSEIGGKGVRN